MVTGSPSNVDPSHYGGPAARDGNEADPARDATTLPLIRRALARGLPLLCICRGIQELNVALGGSLHQHVHELPGRFDHRSDKTKSLPERYGLAHPIRLTPGGAPAAPVRRGGADRGQLPARPGHRPSRRPPDRRGRWPRTARSRPSASSGAQGFALAVQWHPEWQVLENPWSRRLFAAFGAAARARAAARIAPARVAAIV